MQTSLSPPHSAPLFSLRIHCIAYFWFSWRLNTNISQCYLQWKKSHLYLVFWCKIYDLLCRFACKLQLLLLIFNPVHFRCESFAINVCNCSPFLFLYPALLCSFLATGPLRDRGMSVASNNNNRCFWLNVLYNLVLHNFAPTLFFSVDHKINYHHCCCHHCYRQLHATIVCSCISFSLSNYMWLSYAHLNLCNTNTFNQTMQRPFGSTFPTQFSIYNVQLILSYPCLRFISLPFLSLFLIRSHTFNSPDSSFQFLASAATHKQIHILYAPFTIQLRNEQNKQTNNHLKFDYQL